MAITAAELLVKVGYDDSAVKEGLKGSSDKVKESESVLSGHAKAIGLGAGAAGGAALAIGLFSALDAESQNDRLAASLGISNPEYAAALGTAAGNVYSANFGSSLADVNEAIKGIMLQGLVPEDSSTADIEAVTSKVLTLSDTFGQDLAGTTAAVGQMLKTGLAPDADAALDILTRGFQQGTDKSGDLLDTFGEYGTQFRSLGLDGGTAMGLLSQGLNAGARDADTVADALKEFAILSQESGGTASKAFTAMGMDAGAMTAAMAKGGPDAAAALDMTLDKLRAMEPGAERTALAVGLFGTKAEDMQESLYALDPSRALGAMGNIEGAADKLADTMGGNLSSTLETFKRQGMMGLATIGTSVLMPALQGIISVFGFLGEHMDIVAPILAGLAVGLMAALIPALWGWLAVQVPLALAVIATNLPLIALGLVIAGLVAGIIWAYQNCETFRDIVQSAFGVIQTVVTTVIGVVQTVISTFVDVALGLWETFGGTITTVVDTAFGLVQVAIDTVFGVIMGLWHTFKALFTGDWNGVWDGIKDTFGAIWNGLKDAFSIAINAIWTIVQDIGPKILGWFTDLPGKMLNIFDGMFDGISDAFKGAINYVIRGWNGLSWEIPGFKVGPIGYDGFSIGTPDIPLLAKGGTIARGGWAITGDQGPELGYWPTGAQVRPLDSAGAGAAAAYHITVNMPPGSDGNDVVDALKRWQRSNGAVPIKVAG